MPYRCLPRACYFTAAGSLKRTEPLALKAAQRIRNQCFFGDTEERYHQPIDRGGFTPATRLQRSVGQSDEAHFWLNGYVNKQNCRIWSEANPQVYVETPLHPEKLTVWCASWAGGILLQKRCRPQRYSQW
ncbi:hypothetical protein TNCV_4075581 [Trichonephila clavipes]|nr:hypothetical protein TNCV_4075581 [Trichonephila clavipes]